MCSYLELFHPLSPGRRIPQSKVGFQQGPVRPSDASVADLFRVDGATVIMEHRVKCAPLQGPAPHVGQ